VPASEPVQERGLAPGREWAWAPGPELAWAQEREPARHPVRALFLTVPERFAPAQQ
jgi:hypothetical protein